MPDAVLAGYKGIRTSIGVLTVPVFNTELTRAEVNTNGWTLFFTSINCSTYAVRRNNQASVAGTFTITEGEDVVEYSVTNTGAYILNFNGNRFGTSPLSGQPCSAVTFLLHTSDNYLLPGWVEIYDNARMSTYAAIPPITMSFGNINATHAINILSENGYLNAYNPNIPLDNAVIDFFSGLPSGGGDDPYAPGGDSGEGGGGGEQNFDSEDITPTPLPTFSFADSGFCRIYKPTMTELRALANYMWTDDDFLTTVLNHAKQLLEDPMESIISFSLVPVVPPTSAPESVKVLFIPITGVSMAPVTNQFVQVDCGTLSFALEDNYGSALDFNPYTTIDLYLPFIGQVTLDTDEVMYKTIRCRYNVDVVTGMCVASISVITDTGESVRYQFAGHCGVQMPLTSADFSGYVGAIIGATKMVAGLAAAGAGAPAIGAGIVGGPTPQTSTTVTHREPDVTTIGGVSSRVTTRNPATGRQITAGTSERAPQDITRTYGDRTSQYSTSPPSFGELATKGAVNTVDAVMGGKMIIQHSGGFTGNSGFIAGVTYPYAIIKRPRQCRPANYAKYHGYPSMIYMNLGSVSGYTEVNEIHLEGMSATNPELGEIAMLLKSGVIL